MTIDLRRREFLRTSAALAGGAACAGLLPTASFAQEETAKWASLQPGFTVLITAYIQHHKLDEKNGFKLAPPQVYTSVPTYYGDFVSGNYDVCIGSWDSFAVRYLGGVPIKLVCNITTGEMINIMSTKDSGIESAKDLPGKTVAAPQSTGTYRVTRAVLKAFEGIDLEKEATVQNVTNPAASVSLLRAGSADAALTWEPNVTNGMAQDPRLNIIFNTGKTYREQTGLDLPYFAVAARKELLEKDKGIGAKIDATFKDCIDGILGDTDAALEIVGDSTGYDPAVLKEAITSGRLSFKYTSMNSDAGRESVNSAAKFFVDNGLMDKIPDAGFLLS